MFIRETFKKSKDKKIYVQHQLVESIRTPSGPRQNIILNLGQLDLDRSLWKALANAIEALLNNQLILPLNNEVSSKAAHFVQLIRKQRLADKANSAEIQASKETPQYEYIDVNSLTHNDSKTIGAEHVALSQMREYKIEEILKNLGFSDSQIIYAQMLICARMIHPSSERETARWLLEDSALSELLNAETMPIYDSALHRVAVMLYKNHEKIEQEFNKNTKEIFSLGETILLYDLTNTYFESSKKKSLIAKYGKSKERRNDCPLFSLALIVDEEGFPKESKIWPGNISEPETLKDILKHGLDSKNELFNKDKTIVIDAGIATEENLNLIKEAGYKYVALSRKKYLTDLDWEGITEEEILLSDEKTTLKLRQIRQGEDVFVLCHSEIKAEKDKDILTTKMKKFEGEMQRIKMKLKKKGTQKSYAKILEQIGRAKERYNVGNLYTIQVEEKEGKAITCEYERNQKAEIKERNMGTYLLRTNRVDLSSEEISKIHRTLTTIEDSFEKMKSSLGLRPNFHRNDIPMIAHAHITVLAYYIMAGIIKRLRDAKIHYNWESIRNILSSHTRVTTTANTKDEQIINIRTCTTPTEKQSILYDKLGIKKVPLKRIFLKESIKTKKVCSVEKIGQKL